MILTHLGKTPRIDASAYVAPNAVVCGDVTIGADCRILFGAQVIAEGGSIAIGRECIVMENALSFRTAKEIWTVLDRVNHPSIAACWDVFNAALIG